MSARSLETIPLESLSLNEKMSLIEMVWDSLSQKSEDFSSPEWHGEVLHQRVEAVETLRPREDFVNKPLD